jgi:glucokinase
MDPIKRAYDESVLKIYRGKAKMLISQLDDAKVAVLGASALGWELLMHNA